MLWADDASFRHSNRKARTVFGNPFKCRSPNPTKRAEFSAAKIPHRFGDQDPIGLRFAAQPKRQLHGGAE